MVLTLFKRIVGSALLVLLFGFSPVQAGSEYTLKFATLAPQGSTWMNLLEDWGEEVATASDGRLTLKFYPGGMLGDEPEVLKKIRYNQIQGAALTGYGIGSIHSPARILEFPFLFDSYEEIDFVRAELMPDLEAGFRENGYELLGWMEVGFAHFFSTEPIESMDDLKERKIWLWQGDPLGQAWFDAGDLAPVPLSITDVFTSLSTGLIDTVYCTPLAAIALQWYTKTDYMTAVPMANGIGALVVSNRFFHRLPEDLQTILRESGRAAGERLIAATRVDNETSMSVLQEEGLQFRLSPEQLDPKEILALRERAAQELIRLNYIPDPLFNRTTDLLTQARQAAVAVDATQPAVEAESAQDGP